MKLSIIIPAYNAEHFVEKCVNSCIDQDVDFYDYELVAVNDGSKDKTLSVLESLKKRVKNLKIISQENGGLSAARNAGIENSVGEYIWFVDSDDWIEKNCLSSILNKIEETNVDVLSIYADDVEDGRISRRGRYSPIGIVSGKIFLEKYKKYNCAPFYIYRRSLLDDNGIRFVVGLYHEDNEFTPRTLYHARTVTNMEGYFYHILKHSGTITTTPNPKKLYDLIRIADNYRTYVKSVPLKDAYLYNDVIGNNINQAMFECYNYDNAICTEVNQRISEGKFASNLIKSSKLKYKVEGVLFTLFPKKCLKVYFFMQLFNRDRGGQKKSRQLVNNG